MWFPPRRQRAHHLLLHAQIIRLLALVFVLCVFVLLFLHQTVLMKIKSVEVTTTAMVKEEGVAGLAFSTDRLVFGPAEESYWVALAKQPKCNVTVRIQDASHCASLANQTKQVVFTVDNWNRPRRVRVRFRRVGHAATEHGCPLGFVHECDSQDPAYLGLRARLWVEVPTVAASFGGEEPVLERHRARFDFMATYQFHCRELALGNAMQCALGRGTLQETPFYVVDSAHNDTFPVVFVMGGAHGNEVAGSAAAVHVAQHLVPTRGRLVVLPFANVRGLRAGRRLIPDAVTVAADFNRNFPLDRDPVGDLAQMIWSLLAELEPDLFLDLHEGWGYFAHTKALPKSSKGSSVICTSNAKSLARFVLGRMNTVGSAKVRFELLTPPIAGGLAVKLSHEFDTKAMLFETTKAHQSLELRVTQHVEMVVSALEAVHMLAPGVSTRFDGACVLFVRYGQEFADAACLRERLGVMDFKAV